MHSIGRHTHLIHQKWLINTENPPKLDIFLYCSLTDCNLGGNLSVYLVGEVLPYFLSKKWNSSVINNIYPSLQKKKKKAWSRGVPAPCSNQTCFGLMGQPKITRLSGGKRKTEVIFKYSEKEIWSHTKFLKVLNSIKNAVACFTLGKATQWTMKFHHIIWFYYQDHYIVLLT